MATPNRILSLNFGTQTIGLAEFQAGKDGGLVLTHYQTTELLADPAVDSTRLAQAKISVGELIAARGLKGAKINYAVSAQSVFTRFVKLPSVGEEQVEQIVGFEAQQNVPFPIDEVVWDYQLVDQGNSAEVEVVLVAIKADLLDEINDAVETPGFQTTIVDVSPMALYNAYRYNYSDVSDCTLLIDIGARTTNLIFIEPRKVFSRSIPIGGTKVTEAIAKDFGEAFAVSEIRKKNDGFVSLGGTYADPDDPDVARVSKMIRNTMTRLHAEISRSISFYRSQQHGTAPQSVLLCGGSVSLPYMREFFHEKLQLPVDFFNPLRNVTIGAGLNVEEVARQAHTLGEPVGLALRSVMSCPMEMNLRPASVVRAHRIAEQRPYFILAGICLWLALVGFWLYYNQVATVTEAVVQNMEPKVNGLKGYEGKINAVRSDMKKQEELSEPFLKAVRDREAWTRLVEDINQRLPKDYVWITSFALEEKKKEETSSSRNAPKVDKPEKTTFLVKGLYLENPQGPSVVDAFVEQLNASPLYEVNTDPEVFKRSVPNDNDYAFDFAFPLELKSNKPEGGKTKSKAK
jgi:type IV pilus assembly protein PilM